MNTKLLILFIFMLSTLNVMTDVDAVWFNSSWDYKKEIQIDGIGDDIPANYQLKIEVDYDSDMQSDFDDLRFTNSDENVSLDYWVEQNVSSTNATVWVEVPSISNTTNTTIYMYYDNPTAESESNATAVFGNNIQHLWTFNGDLEDKIGEVDLTNSGTTFTTDQFGNANEAVDFILASSNYLYNSTASLLATDGSMTIIMNIKFDILTSASYYTFFSHGGWAANSFLIQRSGGATNRMKLAWNQDTAYIRESFTDTSSWHHMAFTVTGTTVKMYFDGNDETVANEAGSTVFDFTNPKSLDIGRRSDGAQYFDGKISDIKIYNRVLSQTEVSSSYTATEPTYSIGAEESQNTAPTVTLNSPADDSTNASKTVNFSFTPIDETGFISCALWTNETSWSEKESNTSSITNNSINTIAETFTTDGTYLWNVKCIDSGSLSAFASSNWTITIDTTAPTYSDNSTNTTLSGTSTLFSLKWQDSNLSGYIFSFDNGTGSFTNDSFVEFNGVLNWSNVTKTVNSTIGATIQWKVYANDTFGHLAVSDTYTYNTTEIESLEVVLDTPANDTSTNDDTPDFVYTVTGGRATYNCELFINDTGYGTNASTQNNTATTITANTSIGDGESEWNINCTANGITNTSEIRTITIDTIPPTITIYSPENTTYCDINEIDLNWSADETIDWAVYSLNGGNNVSLGLNYQEDANSSSASAFFVDADNLTDGDWNSYSDITEGATGVLYANYTKLFNALNASLQLKYGGDETTINISILTSCFDYYEDVLELGIASEYVDGFSESIELKCYNGSWISLFKNDTMGFFNYRIYEEAIWWEKGFINTTINVIDGQNNITVWANDTAGNINSTTVYFFIGNTSMIVTYSTGTDYLTFDTTSYDGTFPADNQNDTNPAITINATGNIDLDINMSVNTSIYSCIEFWVSQDNTLDTGSDYNITNTNQTVLTTLNTSVNKYLWSWAIFDMCTPGDVYTYDVYFDSFAS